MPNLHDIERHINSVRSTRQITRTMEMVAAAKIRRATDRVENATPWALNVAAATKDVARHAPLAAQPLLRIPKEIKRVLIIAITSDRGLAGGFSSNVLRSVTEIISKRRSEGVEISGIPCGKKACSYFKYYKINTAFELSGSSSNPKYQDAVQISNYVFDLYSVGDLDEVYLVYNHAKNPAQQVVIKQQVLPISYDDLAEILDIQPEEEDIFEMFREKSNKIPVEKLDIDFEPNAEDVMHLMMKSYMRNTYYFALMDSAAAEQGARSCAMKAATDNANEMLDVLTTYYNRVRQGAITTEITEIVGGAAALEV